MRLHICSGGQTGADRAALIAATRIGFPTSGWMPKGFKALDGNHPEYEQLYHMKETESLEYPDRTSRNVRDSSGTLRIGSSFVTPGEKCTESACQRWRKPYMDLLIGSLTEDSSQWKIKAIFLNGIAHHEPSREAIVDFCSANCVLNIAGNSHRVHPSWQLWCVSFLTTLFRIIDKL